MKAARPNVQHRVGHASSSIVNQPDENEGLLDDLDPNRYDSRLRQLGAKVGRGRPDIAVWRDLSRWSFLTGPVAAVGPQVVASRFITELQL